jgi:ABC-type branched-subunit amino acid transport system ATPase component
VGWSAAIRQRRLALCHDEQAVLELPLDHGGRYRLVLPDEEGIAATVAMLEAVPGIAVLPGDGGLLGAMTVSANLSLALGYGREVDAQTRRDWDHMLQLAFRLCGVSEERVHRLGAEQPMRLERMERWLAGFVLHLMRPPELLVIDRAFAGLSRRQAETLLRVEAVYHEFHPFRPVLFVDLDAHGLPDLPGCRRVVEFEGQACPS